MNEDILENFVNAQKLKIVQQGVQPNPESIASQDTNPESTSIGDRLRKSLDNIISNRKPVVYGVVGSMLLAGGALTILGSNMFNPNKPLTISNSSPTATTKENEIQSPGLFESITNKIKSTSENLPSFPILKTTSGKFSMSDELKTSLEDAARFSIPEGFKENQISRYVSQVKFKSAMEKSTTQDFLAALMSEGEGFRSNLYRDNIGLAYGIGWNVSMQSREFNTFLMSAVNNNPEAIKQITSFSSSPMAYPAGKYGTEETKMPVQRHLQASLLIADTFKNEGVLKGLEKHVRNVPEAKNNYKSGQSYKDQTVQAFNSLDPNIQAALIYHSYKVGSAGYGKYNTLNQRVAEYAFTPVDKRTAEQRRNIAETISYTYKYNGETLRDTRAEIKVAAMISNPEAFGSMIKSNPAPKTIYDDVPQLRKNNVSVPQGTEEFNIPDPVGELKQSSLESGKPLDLKMQFNYGDLNLNAPAQNAPKRRTGVPHFW